MKEMIKIYRVFNKPEFKICDEELHDFLNRCVLDNKRNVKELNHFKRFQSIPIYDTLLKIDDIKALSPEGRNQRENLETTGLIGVWKTQIVMFFVILIMD